MIKEISTKAFELLGIPPVENVEDMNQMHLIINAVKAQNNLAGDSPIKDTIICFSFLKRLLVYRAIALTVFSFSCGDNGTISNPGKNDKKGSVKMEAIIKINACLFENYQHEIKLYNKYPTLLKHIRECLT